MTTTLHSSRLSLFPSSSPSPLSDSPSLLSTSPSPHLSNDTAPPRLSAPPFVMSYVTMVTGVLSNLLALVILVRGLPRGPRRRFRGPYLQLASALLLTDLGSHLVPGALALSFHMGQRGVMPGRGGPANGSGPLCQLFGACMVYFGLAPPLLGGAMAVERCLGISKPFLHATVVTVGRARVVLATLCGQALLLAVLPLLGGTGYVPQFPGTWCFLRVRSPLRRAEAGMALAFCCLGLGALALSLLCNALSGIALLRGPPGSTRRGRRGGPPVRPSRASPLSSSSSSGALSRSLELEMMSQLAAITLVSCVCWSPFLAFILKSAVQFSTGSAPLEDGSEHLVLLGLRLASWNQVLDPWIYILLRRAVLRRLCQFRLNTQPRTQITRNDTHNIRVQ